MNVSIFLYRKFCELLLICNHLFGSNFILVNQSQACEGEFCLVMGESLRGERPSESRVKQPRQSY